MNMSRFAPARTSSPAKRPASLPAAAALARNLLDDSRSSVQSIPELIALTPEEIDFIDAVIERATPSAATFLTVFKAYSDLLQERGVDPQDEILYYGKLLKLGNVKGKDWGEKWQMVKDQQVTSRAPSSKLPSSRNPPPPQSRTQVLTRLTHTLKRIERDDDAFTLHSHQDDTESTTPAKETELTNPTTHLRTPRFVRRPTSPSPTNSLLLDTGPPATAYTSTPRAIGQPLARRALNLRTQVLPPTWDAETSEHTSSTPASTIPPSYGAATRGNDDPQRPSSYTPLRALAKAHLHSKVTSKDDVPTPPAPVIRNTSAREAVLKARERRGSVLNEDDAWNKVKMAQDEKAADRFREERLVERCFEVWKNGYEWITTTNEQIAEARENLVLRLAIHKWRTRTAQHKALYERIATLSNNRRLRLAIQTWKGKLREKRQSQWRNDMRSKMKLVRNNHERKLVRDAWTTWRLGFQAHSADEHLSQKLLLRFFNKWRARLGSLDALDTAGDRFIAVRDSMALDRSWQVWRHSFHILQSERTMTDRVGMRLLSEAMVVWKNRMRLNQIADDFNNLSLIKRTFLSWKAARDRIRSLERRADKHLNRQNDVLVRAVVRVWKAHERGKLLERVMSVRSMKQAWTTWKRRLREQRSLEDTAVAFSMRSSSALASSSIKRWQQVYSTHRNAQGFAVQYNNAQLSFKMLLTWRILLRKKMKLAKQAKIVEKYFVMRRALAAWKAKVAEVGREKKVQVFERGIVKRRFEVWRVLAQRQRSLKLAEEEIRQRIALRIMSSTLTHWTNTVADFKFRELETSQRYDQAITTAAFKKWKDLCIRHVEELSLMESYQDVKREENMRRIFYRWLNAARMSRHRRMVLQEREEQMKLSVVASAWDKWRERYQDTRLQPMADIFLLQSQKNLVFRAFGIWHSKSRSLPAVRFHASHAKARAWKIWRDAMPKAMQSKQARDMDRNSVLSRAFDKWLQAYKTKMALKAVARARYLRLPTAAPRQSQSTQPIRTVPSTTVPSTSLAFPRRNIRPVSPGDEDNDLASNAAAVRPFKARAGIASLLTTKPRSASPERTERLLAPPFKLSAASTSSRAKPSVTARTRTREVSPTRSVASVTSAATRKTDPFPRVTSPGPSNGTPGEVRRSMLWQELRGVQMKSRTPTERSKSREPP
ncbi:Sfi1 spindle body protein-domain-containing protein [Cristinia sonorae]|uniref:Sfi1 spindle body protein-domain-containing protein n=1 Tax=Cristinia sonorae TaxID=1940300 RepID=A0A8K0XU70_9AGAR|nr:Sfi1 spindle body protein-domain-containing protein [Cristinia sonorae]